MGSHALLFQSCSDNIYAFNCPYSGIMCLRFLLICTLQISYMSSALVLLHGWQLWIFSAFKTLQVTRPKVFSNMARVMRRDSSARLKTIGLKQRELCTITHQDQQIYANSDGNCTTPTLSVWGWTAKAKNNNFYTF